jgi:hypothetical protein
MVLRVQALICLKYHSTVLGHRGKGRDRFGQNPHLPFTAFPQKSILECEVKDAMIHTDGNTLWEERERNKSWVYS